MTSKYAIALYGLLRLRANRRNIAESIPIDRFRELMGVPPGKLLRGPDFERRVLDIAALEVNKLSEVNVELQVERKNSRAPITAVIMVWRRKTLAEMAEVERELRASKIGRMARLRGEVEQVESRAWAALYSAPAPAFSALTDSTDKKRHSGRLRALKLTHQQVVDTRPRSRRPSSPPPTPNSAT